MAIPTFAAVIGSRTCGIKMGSPVKVRRYPRSCKEASTFYLWSKQPLWRYKRHGKVLKTPSQKTCHYTITTFCFG